MTPTSVRSLAVVATCTHLAVAVTTAPAADAAPSPERGKLVSAEPLGALSAKRVSAMLRKKGFQVDPGLMRHGVDSYRLIYRTVDSRRRPTTASGLLVLPRGGDRELRTVSFTHGTASYKPDVPSVSKDAWDRGPAHTYASAGFAAVAPDYLGLGRGPGRHPWMNVPSETTASLDMLRAARAFAPRTGRTLRREVMVTGFSQGATAAMGLGRALQSGADRWFRLRALAPVSGAYDWRSAQLPALVGGKLHPKFSVAYSAYLLVAWDRQHDLYGSPREVFKAPYAKRVGRLFNGTTPGEVMLRGLPNRLNQLLTAKGYAMLRHPSGRMDKALKVMDSTCKNWTPRVPIRLYVTGTDEQASAANTYRCRTSLRSHGVPVRVVDLGDTGHENTNRRATAQVARWFLTLG